MYEGGGGSRSIEIYALSLSRRNFFFDTESIHKAALITISRFAPYIRRAMSAVAAKRPEWVDILNKEIELNPKFTGGSKSPF